MTELKTAGDKDRRIKKIVVAVDLSPHSEKTAAYAADFARRFGASISLVHVFASKPVRTLNAYETAEEEKRHDTERKFVELVKNIEQIYPNCDVRFRNGDPAEQIALLAEELDADLIVTSRHQPGFLARLFEWDQAARILHRADCSVLVYNGETEAT